METSINEKDLMRGDLKSMAEFLRDMVDRGIFTPNDALEFMGEDTFEEGNIHLMPLNYTTIEKFAERGTDNVQNIKEELKTKVNGHR